MIKSKINGYYQKIQSKSSEKKYLREIFLQIVNFILPDGQWRF